MENLQS